MCAEEEGILGSAQLRCIHKYKTTIRGIKQRIKQENKDSEKEG
jgi:hypothetical protein